MLKFFNTPWHLVPTVWLDTETTGVDPGLDRCVQIAAVRFEGGEPVAALQSLVNPGMPIPAESTAIHGVTDQAVEGAPTVEAFMARPDVRALLADAQPAAYNAGFDRQFIPPFGEDWTWPWLDSLSFVRKADRYVRGSKRHRLAAACARHGVELPQAHEATSDATAAGRLLYKLARERLPDGYTMGQLLGWQRRLEAVEWFRHMSWRSTLPPREGGA
jgi:DNA polymerase III subunit epsilon